MYVEKGPMKLYMMVSELENERMLSDANDDSQLRPVSSVSKQLSSKSILFQLFGGDPPYSVKGLISIMDSRIRDRMAAMALARLRTDCVVKFPLR